MSQSVLILGGNRFVGRKLAETLRDAGVRVSVFHRSEASVPGVDTIRGDRMNAGDLRAALSRGDGTIVDMSLYEAGHASVLLDLIGPLDVHYIAVSSAVVYAQGQPTPWTEQASLSPASGWGAYGAAKLAAESSILGAKLPASLVLRPTYFVGPRNPIPRCAYVFARAAKRLPVLVPGDGSAQIQILDADDFVAILVEAIERRIIGLVNVPGSSSLSVRTLLESCATRVASHTEFRSVFAGQYVHDEERWPFANLDLCVSGDHFRSVFSHRCRSADSAIDREFSWWQTLPLEAREPNVMPSEKVALEIAEARTV